MFNRKGYAGASTREIASEADVSESLIFRYFGSKAGLFREAMVVPFVALVDRHIERRLADPDRFKHPRQASHAFIGDMYDTFHEHRALAMSLFTSDVMQDSALAEEGVLDTLREQVERLASFGTEETRLQGANVPEGTSTIATRALLALTAGMSMVGESLLSESLSRDVIVDEINDWLVNRYLSES